MAADIPDSEPSELRAGDTWKWTKTVPDYPATTWSLKYYCRNAAGGFEITASASGDDFSVTVAAATTAAIAAGTYAWIAEASYSGEKYTVDSGTFVVLANLRTASPSDALDVRTHARKVLDAIEAVLERRATKDQKMLQIAGKTIERFPITDLLKLRQVYRAEVKAQEMAEAIANGTGTGRRIQFRL